MVKSCSAFGCKNKFDQRSSISFHSFPLNNEALLKAWVHATGRKNFIPTVNSRLCGKHFQRTDYLDRPGSYRPQLKPDAVPSIFSTFPDYDQPNVKKPKLSKGSLGNPADYCLTELGSGPSSEVVPNNENLTGENLDILACIARLEAANTIVVKRVKTSGSVEDRGAESRENSGADYSGASRICTSRDCSA